MFFFPGRCLKRALRNAQAFNSAVLDTHIHTAAFSLISRAPESLHSCQSVLQRVLHIVHQPPERHEWGCGGTLITPISTLEASPPPSIWTVRAYITEQSRRGKRSRGDALSGANGCERPPPLPAPPVTAAIRMHAILTASHNCHVCPPPTFSARLLGTWSSGVDCSASCDVFHRQTGNQHCTLTASFASRMLSHPIFTPHLSPHFLASFPPLSQYSVFYLPSFLPSLLVTSSLAPCSSACLCWLL